MKSFVQFVDPDQSLQVFGIRLLGLNALTAHKFLLTFGFFVFLYLVCALLRGLAKAAAHKSRETVFWTRQAISLITLVLGALGFLSIWFDDPSRLATGAGLMGAGVAFALQQVITSFAGYFVILRGKTFNVGDRIQMGGVRGDVVALNFLQTVIMEMGQPPKDETTDSPVWVESRQFTGRIVTIANSKIFDDPVYNYTRDFPYLWEEMHLPILETMQSRILNFVCRAVTVLTLLYLLWIGFRHESAFGVPWFVTKWEGDLSLPSPDGRYVAVVLRGDASAISDFSYRVYVLPQALASKAPAKKAPVSLTGIWNDKRYLVYAGDAIPLFRWTSNHEVEIDLNDLYDEVDEFHPVAEVETPLNDSRSAVLVSLILNKQDKSDVMP